MSTVRVSKEGIEKRIKDVEYHVLPSTTITICRIIMVNGYGVLGQSACVDPANFDAAVGRKFSYEDAFDKIWALEGYLLAEKVYRDSRGDTNTFEKLQNEARWEMTKELMAVIDDESALAKVARKYLKALPGIPATIATFGPK